MFALYMWCGPIIYIVQPISSVLGYLHLSIAAIYKEENMITNCIIFVLGICDRKRLASFRFHCQNRKFEVCNKNISVWQSS